MTDDQPEAELTAAQKVVREAEAIWFGGGTKEEKCAAVGELFEKYHESLPKPVEYKVPG